MHRINAIWLMIAAMLLSGCIKSFDPQIDSSAESSYVVSGRVTDVPGWQEVEISRSSPIGEPAYIPVSGCTLVIHDDLGNEFPMEEYTPGKYRVWMNPESLVPGRSYRVKVFTPEGGELVSAFDQMPSGPPLDSVYYMIHDVATADPELNLRVMQFYVDLDARGYNTTFFKWEIEETWEYHAAYPLEYFFDGEWHQVIPPNTTNTVCYTTSPVKNVFTVSTANLAQNMYDKFPLHAIDGHTPRLGILYSIMVSQFAMSEPAYNYWEQLRINSNEQGGLYEKQPIAIRGNLLNTSNPEKSVLGYFYAVSQSGRRYFYQDVEGIDLAFSDNCYEEGLGRFGWKEFFPAQYPIYYSYVAGVVKILNLDCIDCRRAGGTTVKPGFWPK